mgnify:CR=1 FL=1|jgi:hypothetical protein
MLTQHWPTCVHATASPRLARADGPVSPRRRDGARQRCPDPLVRRVFGAIWRPAPHKDCRPPAREQEHRSSRATRWCWRRRRWRRGGAGARGRGGAGARGQTHLLCALEVAFFPVLPAADDSTRAAQNHSALRHPRNRYPGQRRATRRAPARRRAASPLPGKVPHLVANGAGRASPPRSPARSSPSSAGPGRHS